MKLLTRAVWIVALIALLAAPAAAQGEKSDDAAKPAAGKPDAKPSEGKGQKAAARRAGAVNRYFQLPDTIKLSQDQQDQVAALKKEFGPEIREFQQKQSALLTDEQKQARRQVMQELRDSDKKGRERREAIQAALQLTPEQREQQSELQAAEKKLRSAIEPKLHALLTDEQRTQLPKPGKGAAARKNAPAKRKAAEAKPKADVTKTDVTKAKTDVTKTDMAKSKTDNAAKSKTDAAQPKTDPQTDPKAESQPSKTSKGSN